MGFFAYASLILWLRWLGVQNLERAIAFNLYVKEEGFYEASIKPYQNNYYWKSREDAFVLLIFLKSQILVNVDQAVWQLVETRKLFVKCNKEA